MNEIDYQDEMDNRAEFAMGEYLRDKMRDLDRDNYCVFCGRSRVGVVCDDCGEYKGVVSKADAIAQGYSFCPDCDELIWERNELIASIYSPELHGSCVSCYDPTPAGPEYSAGFEMNH